MIFSLSKVFWAVFNPGALIVLAALVGALARLAPWRGLRRAGGVLLGLALGAMLAIAVLPVASWLLASLEGRFPVPAVLPAEVAGIVALGGAIDLRRSAGRGTTELNEHAERMIAFAALARRYPDARLVFAGGSGLLTDQVHRESDFAVGLMADLGIDPERIVFERESRNTYENAVFTMKAADPRAGEVWLLVTSAFHMPRSMAVFRHVGWDVVPYPVDFLTGGYGQASLGFEFTGNLRLVTLGLHEWIGLIAYRIFGWSDTVFPAPSGRSAQSPAAPASAGPAG